MPAPSGLGLPAAPEPAPELRYVAELKIDGLSISLQYERGRFARGATRGDGTTGEDVTANLRTIKAIPARLPEAASLDVRGEVFMPKKEFARINAEREELGLPLYANPRNRGAGSLRQKDPEVTASRLLSAWFYQLLEDATGSTVTVATQSAALERLERLGLPVNPDREPGLDIEGVIAFAERCWSRATICRTRPTASSSGRRVRAAGSPRDGLPGAPLAAVQVPAGAGRTVVEDIVPYVGGPGR